MDNPLRRPEQILAHRPLKQILAAKPKALWTVGPRDNALSAMRLMADKNIGLLVVMENKAIVGSSQNAIACGVSCSPGNLQKLRRSRTLWSATSSRPTLPIPSPTA